MPVDPPDVEAALLELRTAYLRALPDRAADLDRHLCALERGDWTGLAECVTLAHRLHGVAGAYGLDGVSRCGGRIELALRRVLESGAVRLAPDAVRALRDDLATAIGAKG